MYMCTYIYIYIYTRRYACCQARPDARPGRAPSLGPQVRGWRNTVGNLIEFFLSQKPIAGLILLVYSLKPEGYGFIEFEIPNSTTSTVFRRPLSKGGPGALL